MTFKRAGSGESVRIDFINCGRRLLGYTGSAGVLQNRIVRKNKLAHTGGCCVDGSPWNRGRSALMVTHFSGRLMFDLTRDCCGFLLATVLAISALGMTNILAADPPQSNASEAPQRARANPSSGPKPSRAAPGSSRNSEPAEAKPQADPPEQASGKDEDSPEVKVIRRQQVEVDQANLEELSQTALGADGRVAFQFRNQGWPELIQWLADLAGQPLDWLELPADRVNITTPGRYTVEEVLDLFNRHLLSRGFTMLALDGGLTVVKCATVNPALVPRVQPDQLTSLPPHSFVRTSLDVGWLSAEKLAEELGAMISQNGKLTALTTTNRIEAMDAAVTLSQVADMLQQELDANSRQSLAPEFRLRHIPADEAKRLLEQFLGIAEKPEPAMTPEQMQRMQQMQARMQQQGGKPEQLERKKPDISVVANTRQNSILIQAPPDRVAIATEFLKRIDVPGATMTTLADVQNRVQVIRLASLDPEKLIEIVQEMNILEPATRIRVDTDNRAVIVSGSAADRFIINEVITRLDGSGRRFEVLQLRRLDAGEVAESIAFLMGQKDDQESGSRPRYSPFYGMRQQESRKKEDQFRVAANSRYRQVLLWANDAEMSEVRNLLVKLGELPPPGGSDRVIRTLDIDINPETYRYLQDLRQQWQQLSPHPIELPEPDAFQRRGAPGRQSPAEEAGDEATDDQDDRPQSLPSPSRDDTVAAPQHGGSATDQLTATTTADDESPRQIESLDDFERAFGLAGEAGQTADESQDGRAAPIRIRIDAAGHLVISSQNTRALDTLEDFMQRMEPPRRSYHTFVVKHTSATWIKLNLEDFFDQQESSEDQGNPFIRWYFGVDDRQQKDSPSGLSQPTKLRFIDDIDTGTIVVIGASSEQLKTIGELIELWDVPEPVNRQRVRYTRLVSIEYGRADKIAETIKEAYRDLLSSNDKTFQQGQPGQGGGRDAPNAQRSAGGGRPPAGNSELVAADQGSQRGGGADFSFKGKLSLGVDPAGNALLVSAEGEPLLKLVCDMIEQLDQAARLGVGVRVVNLPPMVNSEVMEKALRALQSEDVTAGQRPPGGSRPRRRGLPPEADDG